MRKDIHVTLPNIIDTEIEKKKKEFILISRLTCF